MVDRVEATRLQCRKAGLESLTSHIDRIRGMSSWPVDVGLAARVFGYVIIPPLAWVGAALVENLIYQL